MDQIRNFHPAGFFPFWVSLSLFRATGRLVGGLHRQWELLTRPMMSSVMTQETINTAENCNVTTGSELPIYAATGSSRFPGILNCDWQLDCFCENKQRLFVVAALLSETHAATERHRGHAVHRKWHGGESMLTSDLSCCHIKITKVKKMLCHLFLTCNFFWQVDPMWIQNQAVQWTWEEQLR